MLHIDIKVDLYLNLEVSFHMPVCGPLESQEKQLFLIFVRSVSFLF